tara:strand:- start:333 stop:617 length:285 start_codon:yes stop_codon:yes gene_type:complete
MTYKEFINLKESDKVTCKTEFSENIYYFHLRSYYSELQEKDVYGGSINQFILDNTIKPNMYVIDKLTENEVFIYDYFLGERTEATIQLKNLVKL